MFLVEGSSETGLLRHLSDHIFGVRNFGKSKSMKVIFFIKMLKINPRFQKCSKKLRKIASEMIGSQLVLLNCLYYEQYIFHHQPMC